MSAPTSRKGFLRLAGLCAAGWVAAPMVKAAPTFGVLGDYSATLNLSAVSVAGTAESGVLTLYQAGSNGIPVLAEAGELLSNSLLVAGR